MTFTNYTGETRLEIAGFDKPLRVVYEVTKRDCDARGQMLLAPIRKKSTGAESEA